MVAVFCCGGDGDGGGDRDSGRDGDSGAVMKVAAAMQHRDGRWVKMAVNGGNGGW
jgi:hypothetical protein